MNIETDLSQNIINTVHNIVYFFANQNISFYSLILITLALIIFTMFYIVKYIKLIKDSYLDIDHRGFRKINCFNLFSVILVSQINSNFPFWINIFFGIFIIPVVAWFIFMLKIFILNVKKHKRKKNFVKNQKMRSDIGKQIGVGHRVSRNDLNGIFKSADEMYQDCQPDHINDEYYKRRLTQNVFEERND